MSCEIVTSFWESIQRREWEAARRLLSADFCATWWTSRERFGSADDFIKVNAIYPEGWNINVLQVAPLSDGRILSLVRVDQPPEAFYATSLFTLADGLIQCVEEYWATVEEPPQWRTADLFSHYGRLPKEDSPTRSSGLGDARRPTD